MPKGTHGCYYCGGPTMDIVQVWLRDYTGDRYDTNTDGSSGRSRRQITVESRTRSACETCGGELMKDLTRLLERTCGRAHGCALCGEPSESRIQVWQRDRRTHASLVSRTGSYCRACSRARYATLAGFLNPDDWQSGSGGTDGSRMRGARAHVVLDWTGKPRQTLPPEQTEVDLSHPKMGR